MKTLTDSKGNKLTFFVDESPENPRNWDNIGTMICFHSRYSLGDKHDVKSKNFSSFDEMKKHLSKKYAIILPLFLYDHSGITMSTKPFDCRWDSGQVGFIVVDRERILKEYGGNRLTKKSIEKATNYLIGEVETYDQFISGDVYGFKVEDENGEEINSCYGFYGSDFETNGMPDHIENFKDFK
jgi:hypothetical protein